MSDFVVGPQKRENVTYRRSGFVVHRQHQRQSSEHYNAQVRHMDTSKWFLCNDENVGQPRAASRETTRIRPTSCSMNGRGAHE